MHCVLRLFSTQASGAVACGRDCTAGNLVVLLIPLS